MIKLITQIIQVLFFFGKLYREKNAEKAEAEREAGKKVVDAFAETDKKKRASKLNAAIGDIKRLR